VLLAYDRDDAGEKAAADYTYVFYKTEGSEQIDGLLRFAREHRDGRYLVLSKGVCGGQVVAEINASGLWTRGYVYLGLQLVAVQYAGVIWVTG